MSGHSTKTVHIHKTVKSLTYHKIVSNNVIILTSPHLEKINITYS